MCVRVCVHAVNNIVNNLIVCGRAVSERMMDHCAARANLNHGETCHNPPINPVKSMSLHNQRAPNSVSRRMM